MGNAIIYLLTCSVERVRSQTLIGRIYLTTIHLMNGNSIRFRKRMKKLKKKNSKTSQLQFMVWLTSLSPSSIGVSDGATGFKFILLREYIFYKLFSSFGNSRSYLSFKPIYLNDKWITTLVRYVCGHIWSVTLARAWMCAVYVCMCMCVCTLVAI